MEFIFKTKEEYKQHVKLWGNEPRNFKILETQEPQPEPDTTPEEAQQPTPTQEEEHKILKNEEEERQRRREKYEEKLRKAKVLPAAPHMS